MKILKLVVAPVLSALMLASCASPPAVEGGGNMNAVCVISGEDATGGPTAEFMGQTVNFCCDRCAAKWNKMDDSARKAAIAELNK